MESIIFITALLVICCLVANLLVCYSFRKLNEKIAQSGAFYKTVLDLLDEMNEQYRRINDLHKDIYEQYQKMSKQQDLILKSYEIFKDENEMMLKAYKQIGEAFAHCEGRYSDIYEQFKEIKDKIDELKPERMIRVIDMDKDPFDVDEEPIVI